MSEPLPFRRPKTTIQRLLQFFEPPLRTAAAALLSLVVARLCRLPEAYWAAVTTLVVIQPKFSAALPPSGERFVGTALGALVGGFAASHLGATLPAFGVALILLGIAGQALCLDRNAQRFAAVTLAIIVLIRRDESAWVVALHRFIEVSIGIAVGLAMTAAWPEETSHPTAAPPTNRLSA